MKKLFFYLLALPFILGAVSCSEEKDEPNVLTVNLSEVILTAEENDAQDLIITSTAPWTLTGGADWLHIYATSGIGNSRVKLATKSSNPSSQGRSTTITITSGELTCNVLVKQAPGKVGNCTATPTNIVTLSNGIAHDYKFGSQVSFFVSALGEKSKYDCYTNAEIYTELLSNGKRNTPDESYIEEWTNLNPETEYYIYTIAFDKNGNPGDMLVNTIKTKSDKNQAYVLINIDDVKDQDWIYTTTITVYCNKYYHMAWSAPDEEGALIDKSDVYLAWLLKDKNASSSPLTLADQSQGWHLEKAEEDAYVHVFTWGLNANNEYSGITKRVSGHQDNFTKEVKQFNIAKEASRQITKNSISYDEYLKDKALIK